MYLENENEENLLAENSVRNREFTNNNHQQTNSEGIDQPAASKADTNYIIKYEYKIIYIPMKRKRMKQLNILCGIGGQTTKDTAVMFKKIVQYTRNHQKLHSGMIL